MYFSRTFKALNFDFQIQGLSRTFKVRANPENFFGLFERPFKIQKNDVFLFEISLLVSEILMFFYYAN